MGRRGRVVLALVLAVGIFTGCATPSSSSEDTSGNGHSRAEWLVSGALAPRLVVQTHFVRGFAPSEDALQYVRSSLLAATSKQSVEFLPPEELSINPNPHHAWSAHELDQLHKSTFSLAPPDAYHRGSAAVMHVLYVDGTSSGGDYAGLALEPSIVVFIERIREAAPPLVDQLGSLQMERSVLLHEFGHEMGLVNGGAPMTKAHEDPKAPHHSANPDSVMWAGHDLVTSIQEGQSPVGARQVAQFDSDDLADLRALDAMTR